MTISGSDSQFEALLDYIHQSRGFDFTGYKRSSLLRRVNKRMQEIAITSYTDYLDYLEVHPNEFQALFNTLLINVTAFFRDQPAWEYLSSEVLTHIIAIRESSDSIRVWSAGCSTGQEAYTLAIAFATLIGVEQFCQRVKIYATDVDEDAIAYARQGSYLAREVEGVSPEMLDLYFERSDDRYTLRKDIRRSVIFGCHDLVQDAPISKVDLVVCRNTLIYFNAETQAQILARFRFALRDEGFVFLGKAEMLLNHSDIFMPIDLKHRIFAKCSKSDFRRQLLNKPPLAGYGVSLVTQNVRLREATFDQATTAQIVVNTEGLLILANERARALFRIPLRNLRQPFQDFELSYLPIELRSRIDQAYQDRSVVEVLDVTWRISREETLQFTVQITPLTDSGGHFLGTSITFTAPLGISVFKKL